MKYLCVKDESGKYEIFIFPKHIDHDAFAESLQDMRNQTHGNWSRQYRTVVSAGFVDSNMNCHGRSESIGVSSRTDDTILLKQQFNIW